MVRARAEQWTANSRQNRWFSLEKYSYKNSTNFHKIRSLFRTIELQFVKILKINSALILPFLVIFGYKTIPNLISNAQKTNFRFFFRKLIILNIIIMFEKWTQMFLLRVTKGGFFCCLSRLEPCQKLFPASVKCNFTTQPPSARKLFFSAAVFCKVRMINWKLSTVHAVVLCRQHFQFDGDTSEVELLQPQSGDKHLMVNNIAKL